MSSEPVLRSDADDIAIRVQDVGKCYHIYNKPVDRLKQFFLPRLRRLARRHQTEYHREFWALRDVSFQVRRGETVGIVGRNGAGKSTLLQLICGTLTPSCGTLETNGRIAALLELGSGFNPEFTGRENVVLNATVLGLSPQEIAARFDEIVEFADIGQFIDQSVKTYSSGMMVRLAFAVIAHVDADILVVDEALSVGDVFFQQKCQRFLQGFQAGGGTILFVSHDTGAVTALCETAILLSRANGYSCRQGKTDEICRIYLNELYQDRATPKPLQMQPAGSGPVLKVQRSQRHYAGFEQTENLYNVSVFQAQSENFGVGGAKIRDVWFADENGKPVHEVLGGAEVRLYLRIEALVRIEAPAFGFMIKDRLGQYIFTEGTNAPFKEHGLVLLPGEAVTVIFSFIMPILIQGEYALNVAVAQGDDHDHFQHHWIHDAIIIRSLKSRLVHGISGVQKLTINITIENPELAMNL
ncbi:MAG TPA: ABC transporter ATP-binding protein [Acidocella sp.]|nr:ABC transporter ATP-binding protein [Acidocella sp.]